MNRSEIYKILQKKYLKAATIYAIHPLINLDRLYEPVENFQKLYIFSGLRPESTYFPDAAHPAKTCFLATAAEKFFPRP